MSKKQLINRFVQVLGVLLGISFITFALTYLAPGDPVRTMYASTGSMPSQNVIEQTREAMGLNKPFLVQYFNWITSCIRGDFGISYSMKKPVLDIMLIKFIPTLKLAFVSLAIMMCISIPLGMLAAINKNKIVDYIIRAYTFLGISVPNFWVGMMLLYIVALKF